MDLEENIKNKTYTHLYGLMLAMSGFYFGFGVGLFNTMFEPFIRKIYPEINEDQYKNIEENF